MVKATADPTFLLGVSVVAAGVRNLTQFPHHLKPDTLQLAMDSSPAECVTILGLSTEGVLYLPNVYVSEPPIREPEVKQVQMCWHAMTVAPTGEPNNGVVEWLQHHHEAFSRVTHETGLAAAHAALPDSAKRNRGLFEMASQFAARLADMGSALEEVITGNQNGRLSHLPKPVVEFVRAYLLRFESPGYYRVAAALLGGLSYGVSAAQAIDALPGVVGDSVRSLSKIRIT